jgi:hypothetical protein
MRSDRRVRVATVRSESAQTAEQRRNLLFLGLAGGIGIASLLVVLAALLLTGSAAAGSRGLAMSAGAAGGSCAVTTYKSLGQQHTQNIKARIKYNSYPPTSGTHFYVPALWGNYPTPIAQVQGVHNLEHGGIVIQYGPKVSTKDQDGLFSFYDDDPNAILMAPLPALGSRIAATAWTHLLMCSKFDKNALKDFRKKYRYKGPEKFPKSALEPGQ